ncbi:MAG: TIM barrel protein [Armatimonadetes bacterium]|nr:TIM barrel protein [Armatimonadota bacterium]
MNRENVKNPVGVVPLQYDAFRKSDPETYTPERILTEIAESGYAGVPAAPYSGETPAETLAHLARFGLVAAPGYLAAGEPWKRANLAPLVEKAKRFAAFAAAVNVSECFLDADGWGYYTASGKTRPEIAGRVTAADGLSGDEFAVLADTLNAVGAAMRKTGNVRACLHNHVGTVLESQAELENILAITDPEAVFIGLDTGHLAWAGADVPGFVERHAARIAAIHLKDIYQNVRQKGVAEHWKYATFTQNGLFAEPGAGAVDFPRVLSALRGADYAGWLLVETDVTTRATPGESLRVSREYLRGLGY